MADGAHSGLLDFGQELVVDLFAGGGGASLGIARAYREPDVAVNHDAIAIAVHRANHPNTEHFQADVFDVDPLLATRGRPVGLLWASPDCRHHSKAKGGKPRSKRIRGLPWVVVRWTLATKPRLIEMENVEEFRHWGPLDASGHPIKARAGETFDAFIAAMTKGLPADHPAMEEIIEFLGSATPMAALVRGLGYTVDWREIRACTKGTPTIRKRLVIKFRRDGRPITWSQDTHGRPGSTEVKAGKLLPFHTAAECIDWTIEGRSIFDRPRPLAANTCRRVAAGIWRYVLNCGDPFIVPLRGTGPDHCSTHSVDAPLSTVTGGGTHHALVIPGLIEAAHSDISPSGVKRWGSGVKDLKEPIGTIHAGGGNFALIAAHLTEFANASTQRTWRADEPLRTECANVKGGHFALVSAFLEQANGGFYDGDGRSASEPMSTICASGANQRLVTAYLVKYYGNERDGVSLAEPMHTIPTKDRMGLVQVVHVRQDIIDPALLARAKQCAAFLHEYLPQHFPQAVDLVLVGGYVLADITLRMLVPRELARAQGFPDSYIIERGLFEIAPGVYEWRDITKTDQVRLLGNAVCPDMAEAEIANDLRPLIDFYARAAA